MFYLRSLRAKKCGFTLVEILVVAVIMGILFSGLFLALTTGDFSSSVSQAKADLQAKVRSIAYLLARDIRQSKPSVIDQNNPTADHIKFKWVTGLDNVTADHALSDNYIEYTYNATSLKLTRSIVNETGDILESRVFEDITNTTFYADDNVLLTNDTFNDAKLIVTIAAQGRAGGAKNLPLSFNLTEEVKIRNE